MLVSATPQDGAVAVNGAQLTGDSGVDPAVPLPVVPTAGVPAAGVPAGAAVTGCSGEFADEFVGHDLFAGAGAGAGAGSPVALAMMARLVRAA